MTAEETADLSAVLARVRLPVQPPRVPPASLGVRLRTSPLLHGLYPMRLAVARARRHGVETWERWPEERERARAALAAIVSGTERAGELEALARQSTIESEMQRMLFWRPLRTARMDRRSRAYLDAALSAGRGVLLSSCHVGPIVQTMSVIAARDRRSFCVVAPWFFEEPTHDYWGRRLVRWWRIAQARREHVINSVGAFPIMQALLAQGELVWLLFDMPGSRETHFLGKPAMLATGSARLATLADALILPLRARREGHRTWVDVEAPLDPRDFAGFEELHDALAKVHECWILEFPEALEDPRRTGAWEAGATASGWTRPGAERPAVAGQ